MTLMSPPQFFPKGNQNGPRVNSNSNLQVTHFTEDKSITRSFIWLVIFFYHWLSEISIKSPFFGVNPILKNADENSSWPFALRTSSNDDILLQKLGRVGKGNNKSLADRHRGDKESERRKINNQRLKYL